MKLKLTLNSAPALLDIVVTTDASATVEDVARAIRLADPRQSPVQESSLPRLTLAVTPAGGQQETALPPERPLAEAAIGAGFLVRVVVPEPDRTDPRGAAAILHVLAGPDRGAEFPLRAGDAVIGRDPSCAVRLNDPMVSSRHARLSIGSTVEIVDLNSANGILVDGGTVPRLVLGPGQTAQLGESVVAVSLTAVRREPIVEVGGSRPFLRRPRVVARFPPVTLDPPELPSSKDAPRLPWLSLVMPLIMGMGMFAVTRSPFSLLFIVMGPAMMVGGYADNRSQRKKQLAEDATRFEADFVALGADLEQRRLTERTVRLTEAPGAAEVMGAADGPGDLLWSRRPEHWNFLVVRLGVGTAPSRTALGPPSSGSTPLPDPQGRMRILQEMYREVTGVPVAERPSTAGAIGIAGDPHASADLVRALLVQLAGLHSPAELVVTAIVGPSLRSEVDWLTWLPHTSSPQSPFGDAVHLADSAATGGALLASLEELVVTRRSARAALRGAQREDSGVAASGAAVESAEAGFDEASLPAIVLVVGADAPVSTGRLVQLAEDAADAGVFVLWVAGAHAALPAVCRTFVDLSDPGAAAAGFVREGRHVPLEPEHVSRDRALAFARRLAAVVDAGAVTVDASDLPRSVTTLSLLGPELAASAAAAVDRWRQNGSIADRSGHAPEPSAAGRATLRALVGQSASDALRLDLRAQGPHALVGGTTGSGKSEFLQAWVLAMAAEYSPDRVTFLFVDYKGGSAFADCTSLPHSVGIVTDLTPYLVRRALTSLRAELHHREELLARKKAKDLLELERRGDPETPPALVLVIDEFAALAGEVPEFVDGVVDIAQRGRSLGIHLIMATQRPAGVIKDNLRANTNLRIALRMADPHDSSDVVGDTTAAFFDPSLPGRAVAKTGPGRLVPFQSAYAGGWTSDTPERAAVQVAELRFGAEVAWRMPPAPPAPTTGPTDQARLVATLRRAAESAEVPVPRRPWLDQLEVSIDLASLAAEDESRIAIGVVDVPERQKRELASFALDAVGHVAVFGTSGSGKSTVLRTIAAAAADREEPVHVYALDFGGGSLRMLQGLPHVGSVISGDDSERVVRLLRTLRDVLDDRALRFPLVNASTVAEHRAITGEPTPRILLLVDNYPAFRDAFDTATPAGPYAVFLRVLSEGRQFGVHVVLTADRAGGVPTPVMSAAQQRIVLRLSDDTSYLMLDAPNDVLSPTSPPGRAVLGAREAQIAVLGGSSNVLDQARALDDLAALLRNRGVTGPPPIGSLPTEAPEESLPDSVGGRPVLGISDDDLAPVGFDPSGAFVLAGGPGSGRTTALIALARSVGRFDPLTERFYLGNRRSRVPHAVDWSGVAVTVDEVAALARSLAARVVADDQGPRLAVFVEGIADFLSGPADAALVELIKAVKRSDHLIVAESESSTWASSWPLLGEMKAARRGLVLQPDSIEGDTILRTSFPRVARASFPPGRGLAALGRSVVRVQLPLAMPDQARQEAEVTSAGGR